MDKTGLDNGQVKALESLVKGTFDRPFRFSIDIVDACNLRCVNCPRGVYYKKSTSDRMDLGDFCRLLDKIKSEYECREIELYNWTEPFLHPEVDRFIAEVKKRGIGCILSTNLSFKKPDMLRSVLANPPAFIVSVSGFEQKTHELYHKGSDVERVKENLRAMAEYRDKHGVRFRVEVHCLQFVDNEEDQKMWERFCKEHGFIFFAKPASGLQTATPESVERLIWKPEFEEMPDGMLRAKRHFSDVPLFDPCRLHNKVPIDCHCEVYLCCIYWYRDKYKIGNFFDLSPEEMQRRRLSHHDCSHCLTRMKP